MAVVTFAVRTTLIVALPFIVLVRGAVVLHTAHGFGPWLSVAGAAIGSLAVLVLYGVWLTRRLTGRSRTTAVARLAAPLVAVYCAYALIHLARENAKTDQVRQTYTATHPLLRLALATLVLADADAVVTDLSRSPQDYHRMGLRPNPVSPHFPQPDGWVHAVDLRTSGRGVIRNWAVERYFRVMGFDTLRHSGTGDHLHIELPTASNPVRSARI